ncbi:MAG TPA: hypothetical protein VLN49_16845 [Gemmatimonadaceae bacterium]|nr:hypothetical protein [Gemmatimonadaceae bacterium]
MRRHLTVIFAAAGVLSACAQTARVQSSGEVAPATPSSRSFLPAGTSMTAQLNQSLGTTSSHEGDHFTATLVDPVVATNGATAVPAGAVVHGHVSGLHSATLPGEQSVIRLDFDSLSFSGNTYPFDASISNVTVKNESTPPSAPSTVRGAVTGAAAGAVLGAIISGGDLSKIISGGLLGAAAGTVISLGTGGTQSVIPSGSTMTVRSTQGVQLR